MRVLDLDMDFFLSDPCPLARLGERPDESCARVWSDEEVIRFLEEQCGLSREKPVPGLIFDTHDKALDFWKERVEDGSLTTPFEVVHVDTHSDLAFGPPGTGYVLNVVLSVFCELSVKLLVKIYPYSLRIKFLLKLIDKLKILMPMRKLLQLK